MLRHILKSSRPADFESHDQQGEVKSFGEYRFQVPAPSMVWSDDSTSAGQFPDNTKDPQQKALSWLRYAWHYLGKSDEKTNTIHDSDAGGCAKHDKDYSAAVAAALFTGEAAPETVYTVGDLLPPMVDEFYARYVIGETIDWPIHTKTTARGVCEEDAHQSSKSTQKGTRGKRSGKAHRSHLGKDGDARLNWGPGKQEASWRNSPIHHRAIGSLCDLLRIPSERLRDCYGSYAFSAEDLLRHKLLMQALSADATACQNLIPVALSMRQDEENRETQLYHQEELIAFAEQREARHKASSECVNDSEHLHAEPHQGKLDHVSRRLLRACEVVLGATNEGGHKPVHDNEDEPLHLQEQAPQVGRTGAANHDVETTGAPSSISSACSRSKRIKAAALTAYLRQPESILKDMLCIRFANCTPLEQAALRVADLIANLEALQNPECKMTEQLAKAYYISGSLAGAKAAALCRVEHDVAATVCELYRGNFSRSQQTKTRSLANARPSEHLSSSLAADEGSARLLPTIFSSRKPEVTNRDDFHHPVRTRSASSTSSIPAPIPGDQGSSSSSSSPNGLPKFQDLQEDLCFLRSIIDLHFAELHEKWSMLQSNHLEKAVEGYTDQPPDYVHRLAARNNLAGVYVEAPWQQKLVLEDEERMQDISNLDYDAGQIHGAPVTATGSSSSALRHSSTPRNRNLDVQQNAEQSTSTTQEQKQNNVSTAQFSNDSSIVDNHEALEAPDTSIQNKDQHQAKTKKQSKTLQRQNPTAMNSNSKSKQVLKESTTNSNAISKNKEQSTSTPSRDTQMLNNHKNNKFYRQHNTTFEDNLAKACVNMKTLLEFGEDGSRLVPLA
ncbi:unnamed protein product [Amoebophrya sp. A25]|nr:unnamed protein product [Amoebophrya sp. A25]|eukprot:GSA25T00013822001.1